MINDIGKFLLVIFDIKKKPLCEERLLFYHKASALLSGYEFFSIPPRQEPDLRFHKLHNHSACAEIISPGAIPNFVLYIRFR